MEEIKSIMKQLLEILIEMESKNILHRDIKPDNIILKEKPNSNEIDVILIDFGLSCES
jgi:serine/threonine protein kinase